LFDILADLAEQDPRANVWDDTDVQARLQELGIQMNTTPAADQQQPVSPAAGQQAPGTAPEQAVAEDSFDQTSGRFKLTGWHSEAFSILHDLKFDLFVVVGKGPFKDKIKPKGFDIYDDATLYGTRATGNYDFEQFQKKQAAGQQAPGTAPEQGVAEGQLDELSPGTLSNYVNRAVDDVADRSHKTGFQKGARVAFNAVAGGLPKSGRFEKDSKIDNRKVGISRAIGRMEENTELNTMLKYAGVSLRESVLTDSTGHTLDHILQRFSREVADFEKGADLDQDLFDALYDYYFDDMPYGVKKARTGDPHEWISQRLADDLGITESNSGMIMPEGDPIATVEAMPDLSAPVLEGSCNMTTEGEYCPEHGLAECGMYEMGTVAGSMAPVIGEAPQDPINYNGAITGAYYESKSDTALLARIKSLALLK